MKVSIIILFFITILASCTTFIKNPRKIGLKPSTVELNKSIEGQFTNLNGRASIWYQIKKRKKVNNKSVKANRETVELTIISAKIIKLKLIENKFVKDSIFVSGNFKDNSFTFDTKRNIEDVFPLLWSFNKIKFSIKVDSSNNLVLSRSGWSVIFLIVGPIMAADGCIEFNYLRVHK